MTKEALDQYYHDDFLFLLLLLLVYLHLESDD
jgi:hypothetical protein